MNLFTPETTEILWQLIASMFLGALIGLEREYQGKSAGLRTYALVSLGACLFTIVSTRGFQEFAGLYNVDPSRIAAQIVVGIGFIGGGLIFLRRDVVYGLTTAAGLWISAALGMAIGAGLYSAAILTAVIALLILSLLKMVERYIHRNHPESAHHDLT